MGNSISAPITINDAAAATPYPSNFTWPASQGVIANLSVTLLGLNHTFPGDIDVQLVGPGGQQVTLMSDAGLDFDVNGNVTFDDSAAPLPQNGQIVTGTTYHPTNYEGTSNDGFTAPVSDGNTSLSVFNGTSPTGTWHLFVRDDAVQGTGSLAGWTLSFLMNSDPYPSAVAVSGLPAVVSDVNVSLHGLTSTNPDDLDLLLVGPGGQQALVLSDVGGSTPVASVDLTLDDEAPTSLPDLTVLTTGMFKPTNFGGGEFFPSPAPDPSESSALSVFDGHDPNGLWRLYSVDDLSDDHFTSLSGWSLDFTWSDTTKPNGSVRIAGGDGVVASPAVSLDLGAADPAPASGVAQMRFSNDGQTFSPYQPYAASAPWTLAPGDGTETVYAQFRDADGNESAVVSDTIVLDQTGPAARKVKPGKGAHDVKAGAKVKVTATEALQPSSVTKANVFLKKKGAHGKVRAKLTYDAVTHTIVVKPKKPMHGTYKVTVKGVRDALGNLWDQKPDKAGAQPLKFSFSTV